MALFDFYKKIKKEPSGTQPRGGAVGKGLKTPKHAERKGEERASALPADKKEAKDGETPKVHLKESEIAWRVLEGPHVTEKATGLTHFNQYVFRIHENASKDDVRHAIEEVYGVHVMAVRKIRIPRKERMHGRHKSWKSGYTKAIVELQAGEKIEVLPH